MLMILRVLCVCLVSKKITVLRKRFIVLWKRSAVLRKRSARTTLRRGQTASGPGFHDVLVAEAPSPVRSLSVLVHGSAGLLDNKRQMMATRV